MEHCGSFWFHNLSVMQHSQPSVLLGGLLNKKHHETWQSKAKRRMEAKKLEKKIICGWKGYTWGLTSCWHASRTVTKFHNPNTHAWHSVTFNPVSDNSNSQVLWSNNKCFRIRPFQQMQGKNCCGISPVELLSCANAVIRLLGLNDSHRDPFAGLGQVGMPQ